MPVLTVGHRGDPHAHRENTIPAVLAAIQQGADLVEVDLELTADERLILLHDADLVRLWHDPGRVAELTLAEIHHRCAADRYRVPTLADTLAVLAGTEVTLMADIGEPHIAIRTLAAVRAAGLLPRVLFVGTPEAMSAVRANDGQARIGISVGALAELPGWAELRALKPEYVNPHWPLLTPEFIARAHAEGFGVSGWTVDSPSTMSRLIAQGVDMIISNRIGRLVALAAHATD